VIQTKSSNSTFTFKKFTIKQNHGTMKVNTDGVLLGAWADVENATSILDIGTGTGVIALMLAQRNPTAQIIGVEIDEAASEEAKENVNESIFRDTVKIVHTSIQDFTVNANQAFDVIVSNPPFFTGGTFSANENKAQVRHTIKLPHGDLLHSVNALLTHSGSFCVILPYIEGLRFIELAERSQLYANKITEVRHRKDKSIERLLIKFNKIKTETIKEDLFIMNEDASTYSDKYVQLTKEFYQQF
jgi:tRNA1Val (adenine37-N6)-methyltransferase